MGGLESRKLKTKTPEERKPKHTLAKSEPRKTWAAKMRRKEQLKKVKDLSKQIKEDLKHDQETARAARRANRERKEENERKNMVTQTIKNTRAIAKLSPKARRKANIFLQHEL
eukprot:CAMPEP_0174849810 /NCGR_PEP_ID=MMETSP1114-20130205/17532_1 /TAXON_ID=312471 /ORGANISM="Neobodo designis, Strain CCAP 1951/1" /LENGTH=112 /DNA_ID=CAMNT_0016084217 /DNA_START=33 /DNA_END=371 /DNA_ORIENTATION=+